MKCQNIDVSFFYFSNFKSLPKQTSNCSKIDPVNGFCCVVQLTKRYVLLSFDQYRLKKRFGLTEELDLDDFVKGHVFCSTT